MARKQCDDSATSMSERTVGDEELLNDYKESFIPGKSWLVAEKPLWGKWRMVSELGIDPETGEKLPTPPNRRSESE